MKFLKTVLLIFLPLFAFSQNTAYKLNTSGGIAYFIEDSTDIRFINDFHAISTGTNGVAVGDIAIYRITESDTVYSIIKSGGNQSLTCKKMVPAGYTLYVQEWHSSEGGDKEVRYRLRSTDKNGVLIPDVYLFKDGIYLKKTSSPLMTALVKVPSLSKIKVSAWGVAALADGTASVRGVLVKNLE